MVACSRRRGPLGKPSSAAEDRAGDAGWGNAFRVPAASGELDIAYPRTLPFLLWLIAFGIAWVVVIGGAFSSARPPVGNRRPS